MLYNILPNVILVLVIASVVIILSKRVPEARKLVEEENVAKRAESVLPEDVESTVPSRLFSNITFFILKVWHWMLEAKDLKPSAVASYRMKKVIKKTKQVKEKPAEIPMVTVPDAPSETVEAAPIEIPVIPLDQMTEENIFDRLKDNPKDTLLLGRLAHMYMDQDRFADAAEVFEYLVTLEPGEARSYAKLGFCNFQLGQYASSISNYEKSIALDAAHPNRYYNLGLAHEMLKNWTGARKAFKHAIELDPENAKYKIALNTLNRNLRESRKNSL